jgi:WD40 repeat protein
MCELVTTLEGHKSKVIYVEFHRSLPFLATRTDKNIAKVWLLNIDRTQAVCLPSPRHSVAHYTSICFHPSQPYLVTGDLDGRVRLWRLKSDGIDAVSTLGTHMASVNSVTFHPTSLILATGSSDKTLKLWVLNEGFRHATCIHTLQLENAIMSIVFHTTLPIIAIRCTGTLDLWNLNSDGIPTIRVNVPHEHYVFSVAFHPSAPYLAICGSNRTLELWRLNADCSAATCFSTLQGHNGIVHSVAFHPSRPYLVTVDFNAINIYNGTLRRGNAKLWLLNTDYSDPKCVGTILQQSEGFSYVVFDPYDLYFATGSEDNTVKFWRCNIIINAYNIFKPLYKITEISETILNKLCHLCNLNLCIKNPRNDNNCNGYVIKLSNDYLTNDINDIYVHYNCLHYQLITHKTKIDDINISSDIIHRILTIEGKEDALVGTDFYK